VRERWPVRMVVADGVGSGSPVWADVAAEG